MPAPEVTAVAQAQYDLLPEGWRAHDSDEAVHLLLGLVEGATSPLAEAWELLVDPGPREFLRVETVPPKWFARLAERNGARLTGGMTELQRRAELANPTGWRRILPASILEAIEPFVPVGVTPRLFLRTNPDDPSDSPEAHVTLRLRSDDVADPAALLAAFESRIPVGMFGHLLLGTELLWFDAEVAWDDFDPDLEWDDADGWYDN